MKIGSYSLASNVLLAPMAGITDQPFRQLCCRMGAGLAVSEMISANPKVWKTDKSKRRLLHGEEAGIRSVQIAGSDPDELANAARVNAENGAQIIDINMGCPAKKVNKKLAGSALMKEPSLVEQIVRSVVNAVDIPVTLKIRTGWCENTRNGIEIAKIAESNGIQSLAVHGRTRNDFYKGDAEYGTIKAIKKTISIDSTAVDLVSIDLRCLEFVRSLRSPNNSFPRVLLLQFATHHPRRSAHLRPVSLPLPSLRQLGKVITLHHLHLLLVTSDSVIFSAINLSNNLIFLSK